MSGKTGSAVAGVTHANRAIFGRTTEELLLAAFHRAATSVPAQAALLREDGVSPEAVVDFESFSRLCPVRSKANTFHRFSLDELSVGGQLPELGDVLTSSGHGGVFSFGVSTREQMAGSSQLLDRAFDAAFAVKSRRTLAINCLPMGVVFGSRVMTVANVSVREDMALALVRAFGHRYDQVMLALDPLFAKRLVDYAREQELDWSRYSINAVIGEEIFGEHFRDYLSRCLGLDADDPGRGYICSSFGVGELGLHLCYETPATIAVRRAFRRHPDLRAELLGDGTGDAMPVPMILAFNPRRTFLEVLDRAEDGFGRLTVSMLAPDQVLPLLRYQPGDVAAILDSEQLSAGLASRGIRLPGELPPAVLALRGRDRETLPNGSHVGLYKDALYASPETADRLTGAVRLIFDGNACTMHVQLAGDSKAEASLEQDILDALPAATRPVGVVSWPRRAFPFGMTLDYERKFTYYAPSDGERYQGLVISHVASRQCPVVRRDCGILFAVGLVCLASALGAQDVTDPSLKAAIVYNIAKFTEWPQDVLPANAPFLVCVAGDSAAGREMRRVANGRSLDGRPIAVVPLSDSTPARSCHLLFVAGMPRDEARRIVSSLGMSPVLTITDIEGLTDAGAVVSLFPEAGRTRFDVDLGVAMRARLQLSSRLLALASQVRNGR